MTDRTTGPQSGELRTFAAIGDIHAEEESLGAVLGFIKTLDVDQVLAVGDIVDGRGDVNRCCALLEAHGVLAVRGNHERWFLEGQMRSLPDAQRLEDVSLSAREFLAGLPPTRSFQTARGELLLCHGVGDDDMQTLKPDDFGYGLANNGPLNELLAAGRYRLMVGGHTHWRMVRAFDHLTVINAGTLFRETWPCFVVVDVPGGFAQFYDVRALGREIVAAERLVLSA